MQGLRCLGFKAAGFRCFGVRVAGLRGKESVGSGCRCWGKVQRALSRFWSHGGL